MDGVVTWEMVDEVVKNELKIYKCVMRLKTSSRRLFAFVSIYNFLHHQLTSKTSSNSDEWCSISAAKNLLWGVARIIQLLQCRVKHFRDKLDSLKRILFETRRSIDPHIVMSRHTEIFDPDKKIWKRLHEANITPANVIQEYEKVKHLLPDEAIVNYELRTGPVEERQFQRIVPNYTNMNSYEFYKKYIKSDIVVAKSNELSEMFSETFEIFPGIIIKVPRRIERFFNIEMNNAVKNNVRFPSNYIRGMVLAYFLGEMFGGAFSAMQLFIMGFSNSAADACGNRVIETSFSKLKTLLKSTKLFFPYRKSSTSPLTTLGSYLSTVIKKEDARKIIFDSVKYIPGRKEKAAMAVMRSTVAEHEADGYMAVWLALAVTRLLGRRVTPTYALLFLMNWTAKQYQDNNNNIIAEDYLKRMSISVGITFDPKHGLVVPVVIFGSGLTDTKLKNYAIHGINHFVKKLLKKGTVTPDRERKTVSEITLEQLSKELFKNNDVLKKSAEETDEVFSKMKGKEFIPNEERRQIHEEEFDKALNPKLKLRFRFGVCGYQHPLPASNNKQTLIMQQLTKQRQLYAQRETAAVTNWDRLLQFLFPRKSTPSQVEMTGPYGTFALSRLLNLNRMFVEITQTALKTATSCERVLEDINIKFNTDILTLGNKPDCFLRTKAGLIIGEHARQALENANYTMFQFEEHRRVSKLHPSEIILDSAIGKLAVDLAHGCVVAREHQYQYSQLQPFIPPLMDMGDNKNFEPIPLYGIENPIFPPRYSYVDETATRFSDYNSKFWLKENNENIIDALRSRGIISLPSLLKNRNLEILKSNDNCIRFFKDIQVLNHKFLESAKPRKYDSGPWSSKNTGQSGRNATEFSPNSVIVLSLDDVSDDEDMYKENEVIGVTGKKFSVGGINDIFLAAVETQRNMAKNDIMYPQYTERKMGDGNVKRMIQAPDISPMYRYGGKPTVITLKHIPVTR